jgi:serine/threonine-protein kinase
MARVREILAGRYELHEVLGRGGMGLVYRATDRVLDRPVAIKVLPVDRVDDPAFVARFEREALAAASVSHAHIVSIYDFGRDDGTWFIAMECVSGETLSRLVRARGPLPAAEAARIGAQVASALAAAHRAGVVHRDVKPANIMVDRAGRAKVLDFGIARSDAGTRLTGTMDIIGSASYLAPELVHGGTADARSDIYALGCVLYELLSGRPPFRGETAVAIMQQHASRPPPRLRDAGVEVPPRLEALMLAMLAKDPAARPRSAGEIASALPGALAVRPVATAQLAGRAPTRVMPVARPVARRAGGAAERRRRPRERVGLTVAAVLILVAVATALTSPSGRLAATAQHRTGASATSAHSPGGSSTTGTGAGGGAADQAPPVPQPPQPGPPGQDHAGPPGHDPPGPPGHGHKGDGGNGHPGRGKKDGGAQGDNQGD